MPVIPHDHDWAQTPTGLKCNNCSAFIAQIQFAQNTAANAVQGQLGNSTDTTGGDGAIGNAADYIWYQVNSGS